MGGTTSSTTSNCSSTNTNNDTKPLITPAGSATTYPGTSARAFPRVDHIGHARGIAAAVAHSRGLKAVQSLPLHIDPGLSCRLPPGVVLSRHVPPTCSTTPTPTDHPHVAHDHPTHHDDAVHKVQIVYPDSTPDSTGHIILHYCFQICEIIILGYLGQYFLSQLDPRSQEKNNLKTTQSSIQKRLSAIDRSHVDASTFTTHENQIFADVKTPTEVMVSFAQIGGLSKHKEQIMNTLLANDTTRAKLRAAYGKLSEPAKGMLLHGPPGCGKTLLAKAIASECKAVFIELKISHVTDKWHGESQKLTDAVFSLARKLAPTIIFIDEVDTFLRDRGMRSSAHESSTTSQMKASFLSNWDGLTSDQTTRPMYDATTGEQIGIIQLPFEIIVIGATNRPGDIDEAFHRRMPAQFFIGMPNKAERTSILQIMFDQMSITPTCNPIEIANSTEHYSGSDLKELCRDAVSEVTNELCKNGSSNPRPLTLNDFNKVYHRKNPAGRASIAYKEKQIMEDRLKNNGRSFGGGMD